MTKPATIDLDRDKAYEWLMNGAQPTNTAGAILKFKGVFYRKHLMRGVAKGIMTQEAADKLYNDWIEAKEAMIATRVEETRLEREKFWKMVSGEIKAAKPKVSEAAAAEFREEPELTLAEQAEKSAAEATEVVEEAVEAVAEKVEEVVEAAAETKEAVVEAATEKVEEVVEAVAETKEAVVEKAEEVAEKVEEAATEAPKADSEEK
jgi:small subunit ribosomal protein S16